MGPTFQSVMVCALLSFGTIAAAQQPGVELILETHALEPSEAIDAQLVCTNTGRPSAPEAVVPDGLELRLINPNPSSSSFTQIINGRVSQKTTYTYSMRLTALKEGTYALGPVTVVADGSTYRTAPVKVLVRSSETAAAPRGDRFIFAELEVEPRSLYVTESYVATLVIGIRKVEINGRIFELDLLRNVLNLRASQFSVFADLLATGRVRRSDRWLTDSDGNAHRYETFQISGQVRAEEVGETLAGPVFLKADYPTAVRLGFFGGYKVTRVRKETARAPAIAVDVKAPPEEGRPADFAGAIGRYTMSVTAKPTHLEQGQPITLSISIEGAPLEGVPGPDLNKQPELASRFDYTRDELLGDLESGAKVFRRAVFPKQAGEQTLPSISWSFFDPRQERYFTLRSDPISLTIDPPSAAPTAIALLNNSAGARAAGARFQSRTGGANGTTLTVLTGGISPNFVDIDAVLADQFFALTTPWIASLIVSPLAWLAVTLTTRHRARLKADVRLARRRRARRRAHARIRGAVSGGEPTRQLHGLAEAMTGYLSDRFGLPSGTLTPGEVRSLLAMSGFEETTAAEIVAFLEDCDAVCYAPAAMGRLSTAQAAANVRGWIKRIDGDT